MGDYANIKRKKIIKLLKWLATKEGIEIKKCTKHHYKIIYSFWDMSYPFPYRHNEITKEIVKALMKTLVKSGICTKEEFDENIK